MSATMQKTIVFMLMLISVVVLPLSAMGAETPVMVRQAAVDSPFANDRQIIRTSSGRLYYISGNAGHTSTWDGWIEVSSSQDGAGWTAVGNRDQWHASSAIGAAVDSRNVVHLLTYDWNNRPTYMTFNSADSPKGDHSWEPSEGLESTKSAINGRSAITVDGNDNPHLVYMLQETYKGKSYTTLTYANRIGGVWNRTVIWPKEGKITFAGKFDIAIGPDNIPYILAGNKVLKGNTTSATAFETKDLGTPCYSLVTHTNGDVRVALSQGGNYANYLHSQPEPWSSGWTLSVSSTPDSGGILLLANDRPYLARLLSDGIWLQRDFEPPVLVASQPAGVSWQSLTSRWSRYHQARPGVIDLGTRSWSSQGGNQYWYVSFTAPTEADFTASPLQGVAPLLVSFRDRSIPEYGRNINLWEWDLNKDGVIDATASNPVYRFDSAGKYQVQLKVTDSLGGIATKSKTDFVEVFADSDSDGIPDPMDNCPNDYNPSQLDLNSNRIGDACEAPINRLAKSMYMTGLRSITSADSRKSSDVTGIMTDGLLDQKVLLLPASKDALAVQVNKDAVNIKKFIMRFYMEINGNPLNTRVYVMPYNRDMATTLDVGLSGGWNGWNEFDLTPILHKMDGFGLTKFRIVALNDPSGVSISELSIKEQIDGREINSTPTSLDFGNTEVTTTGPTQNITISNSGTESLSIFRVKPPSWPFSMESEDCTGKTLLPGNACSVRVSFSPFVDGQYTSLLTIDSNDVETSSFKVPLRGTGVLSLRGVVKDLTSGKPLNAVRVEVTDALKTHATTTDINGSYAIFGLAAGNYTAKFSRADYITHPANGSITQSPNNILDAELAFNYASISGTVTDQATGEPLAGVKVTVTVSDISSKDPDDRIYTCNGATLAAADYSRVAVNDGNKYACSTSYDNTMIFKVRNSNGPEPFKISWNGIGALSPGEILYDPDSMIEYLAQSFKPSKNGKLTRASFYLPTELSPNIRGGVHVLLKTKLGGDRGTYLAKSNDVRLDSLIAPNWVDFDFVTPPVLEAGQQYYLEINGTFFVDNDTLCKVFWSYSDATAAGNAYKRIGGLWSGSNTLSFRTYLDGQADIIAAPLTSYTGMYGGNQGELEANLYGIETSRRILLPQYGDGSDGLQGYNGDDLTGSLTVTDDYAKHYDANGWLSVGVTSSSVWSDFVLFVFWKNGVVTDQFDITFTRTLTTTTDANGTYSFPNIVEGNYAISFEKPAFTTKTLSGAITFGQNINTASELSKAPTATLQGTVRGSTTNAPVAGALITVTDQLGVKSAVTYNQGNYLISGIVPGTYSTTITATGYFPKTVTGILASAQTLQLDFKADPVPITVTITSPSASVLTIYTDQITITGKAENAFRVYAFDVYGTRFPAVNVINGDFTLSVPLERGNNYISIAGENDFGGFSNSPGVWIDVPGFTLNNRGDIGNVSVMEFSDKYNYATWDTSKTAIAQEYIATHGDTHDFLVFLSTFDHPLPVSNAVAYYHQIKNDVQGIGQITFDNGKWYGSSGKLQGVIDVGSFGALATNPYGPKLDATVLALHHELMHRWGAYVKLRNYDGTLNKSLLGLNDYHWSYLFDTQGSLMYGSGWKNNGNGTFTATAAMSGYSPLDLYLMGMIPKEQVPPMILIENPAIDRMKLPELGATISGTAKTITIDNIIAAEGERIPNAATSPKKFNVGFILLVKPGENPASAAAATEILRSAWAGKFAELTRGIGGMNGVAPSLVVQIDTPSDNATITGPDVTVSGTMINSTGVETGITVNGVPATLNGSRFIANHVPLQEGANTLTITATDANGMTTTITRSVSSQAGHYLRVSSNIDSGTGPLDVSFRINGSFNSTTYACSASGPVPVTIIPGESADQFSARLSAEGSYNITISAQGPDGQVYADNVTVTVTSKAQLETLLQGKWEGMKEKLIAKNVDGAVAYLINSMQNNYRSGFSPYVDKLPLLAQNLPSIELVYASDQRAKVRLFREESIKGVNMMIGYPVYYIREEGIWKLVNF